MTTKTTYTMVALLAVTVMSFSLTPAFAYSIRDAVEFDDETLGSGFTSGEGSDCSNQVTVTPINGNTEVRFNWNGHSTCNDSFGHSGSISHPFSKVRGHITIDGERFDIEAQSGTWDYFGQETFDKTTTSSSEIDVDFKWYYLNTS